MAEVSLGGVFFPALLLWAVIAFAMNIVLRRVLARLGFYRFVWHQALFDVALFVVLLGATVGVASRVVGP